MDNQLIYKWLKRHVPSRNRINKYTNIFRETSKTKRIFLLDVPTNGNMGDQAIVFATRLFLEKNFPDYSIIEIPFNDVNDVLYLMKSYIGKDDLIIWNGGGNIGDIYKSSEFVRWATFNIFKDHTILIFPQSLYFENNKFLNKSKNQYKKNDNVKLFTREQSSFNFAKKSFSNVDIQMVPDIVFYLENKLPESVFGQKREGVITLLRNDVEKSAHNLVPLYEALNGDIVDKSDTYVNDLVVSENNRKEFIFDKLLEVSRHKMVVTDRLHGMIFAYLTKTPAIVFENSNWKIKSTYNTWLQNVDYIQLIDGDNNNINDVSEIIQNLMQIVPGYGRVSTEFEPLLRTLRKLVDE